MANTALKLANGRQYVLSAAVIIAAENLQDTATAVTAIKLPVNARVISGALIVETAFNPGTSMTLAVGDSLVATRYKSAIDLTAAGLTALVPTGYVSDGSDIQVKPTIVGAAPTSGSARLCVEYVIVGRAQEVQTT